MKYLNKIIEYGILLLVFLIPWQARWIISGGEINGAYWEYGTQSLYATEILLGGILALMVIRFSVETLRATSLPWRERFLSPHGAVLLFLIYAGLSVFWSIDKNTALIHWRWLVEAGAVFLLLGRMANGTYGYRRDARSASLQWAIILSAGLQAIIAIAQFLMQSIPASTILGMASQSAAGLGASVVETLDGRWLRAYGSFPHPNILGGWLVLALVALMTRANSEQRTATRVGNFLSALRYPLFAIILFGLLTTFSRSAWLAFGVFMVLAIFLSLRGRSPQATDRSNPSVYSRDCFAPLRFARNDIINLFAITILSVVIFNSLFPNLLGARVDRQNRLEAKATSERLVGFKQSWQIIKNHPLVGAGIGNYGLAVHREIDSTQPAYYYQPAHNIFLLIGAELGLVGILLLTFYLLLFTCRLACPPEWRDPQGEAPYTCLTKYKRFLPRGYGVETTIFLLPLLVISLFDHYLWSLYSGLMIGAVYLANSGPHPSFAKATDGRPCPSRTTPHLRQGYGGQA